VLDLFLHLSVLRICLTNKSLHLLHPDAVGLPTVSVRHAWFAEAVVHAVRSVMLPATTYLKTRANILADERAKTQLGGAASQ
jgi:hypothetical protein